MIIRVVLWTMRLPCSISIFLLFVCNSGEELHFDIGQNYIIFPSYPTLEAARTLFHDGVAALHSFEYANALHLFESAIALESGYIPSYWGAAMACWQPIWMTVQRSKGRQFIEAGEAILRASQFGVPAPDSLESLLFNSTKSLFSLSSSTKDSLNIDGYIEVMTTSVIRFPNEVELRAFLALGLLGKSLPELRGYTQRAASFQAHLLEHLRMGLQLQPNHPGIP
jgi:hypothetical protein